MNTNTKPSGTLAIQTIAMPADTNANGDIFGGWLVSQMDLAGGIIAKQTSNGRIATIAIDSMIFYLPVKVGDLVCCYASIQKVGTTSMQIKVEVWTIGQAHEQLRQVASGYFTYVAIDDEGHKRPVKVSS